jgi:predicted nucleic acid-binding protein
VTSWLLDTDVVGLLALGWRRPKWASHHFREWVTENINSLFLSVISVVEISASIRKIHREGQAQRASEADIWLDNILAHYGERILAVDAKVGKLAGELVDEAKENSGDQSLAYFLIAATAQAHGHVLLTNDVERFQPLMRGGQVLSPYQLTHFGKPYRQGVKNPVGFAK